MLCAIPLAPWQHVSDTVLSCIRSQTVPIQVHTDSAPAIHSPRERNINASRQLLHDRLHSRNESYILLLDSDVVLSESTMVEKMVSYLDDPCNHDVGCVAIDTKGREQNPNHIICACALVRMSIYTKLHYASKIDCQCTLIRQLCKVVYLPDVYTFEVPR